MMISKKELQIDELEVPGDRLVQILDNAGFKKVRGRSSLLYNLLIEHCPEEWDLKSSTVRSWFGKSAPPMKKIIKITEIIEDIYGFKGSPELRSIQAWWKVGGANPFIEPNVRSKDTENAQENQEDTKKLDFLLPSIIVKEVGDDFSSLSAEQLEDIKSQTINFVEKFTNPDVKSCSDEFLKMAINYYYNEMKKRF